MEKSTRHSKISGDFGEGLILYWLSKNGFEVANIDHTGIDLIAYHKKTQQRLGISVKTRTRETGKEREGVYIKNKELKKITEACKAFGCTHESFGIIVDREKTIELFLIFVSKALEINDKGKRFINFKVSDKYIEKYKKDALLYLKMSYEEISNFKKL